MSFLLDTDVAIHLRDGDEEIGGRVATLAGAISLALPTLIELQAGLAVTSPLRDRRKAGLTQIMRRFPIVPLDTAVVEHYGMIVFSAGFSRSRVFDRLIAATAIVHDMTLVTINGDDFSDIPNLKLEIWPFPAQ